MALVAGVDSSTQSCKVVICDADTGAVVRSGTAPHPDGTEVDPEAWWVALEQAAGAAGGLDDVVGISVAAQQHGMVCLDEAGHVVRPAMLWNDTRSADAATDLVAELGAAAWAAAIGSVPVASFTVTKLRWLAEHEPDALARTVAVCLPHDWLTWRLLGAPGVDTLVTDRGDASGSGWWSPIDGRQRDDLLALATGRSLHVPRVLGPDETAGVATCLAPGRASRSGPATTWAPRSASARCPATRSCRSAPPGSPPPSATSRRVTRRASSPASPTPPAGSCRSRARSTRRAPSTPSRPSSASTTTSSTHWRCPHRPARAG